MVVRRLPTSIRKYGPYTLTFLLGYALRSLDIPSEQPLSPQETLHSLEVEPDRSFSLIVLILTAPANSEVRDVIRSTWLSVSKKKHSFQAFFVLGKTNLNLTEVRELETENKLHDDLLILPVIDTYETLTNKVLESIVFVQKHYRFDFLLKCDDDSFVDIVRVLEELEVGGYFGEGVGKPEIGPSREKPSPRLYWGFFDGRAHVRTTGKFPDPKYKLCDRYVPYALGGGYVLGRSLIDFIANNANQLEQFFSEDASVGAWLGGTTAIRRHDTRFDTQWKSRGCSNTYLVTHKQSVEDMEVKWERLVRSGTICEEEETRVMLSYNYDWTKPPSMCCVRNDWSVP